MEQDTYFHGHGSDGSQLCDLLRKPASQWTHNDATTALLCLAQLSRKLEWRAFLPYKLAVLLVLTQTSFGVPPDFYQSYTCDRPTSEAAR